ncbi:MAG: hypothetical protein KF746_23335 [Chitinophagaceae bacterium]|nr:hypothetical protein [Chitinophagaceae bacterium]
MKNIFLGLILLFSCATALAQKKPFRKQRLIFSHGIGYDLPFQTVRVNPVTDQLSDVNGKGLSFQVFSMSLFVKKNWGVEVLMQGVAGDSRKRNKMFNQLIEEKWSDQYYYNRRPFYNEGGLDLFTGALGLIHKIEKRRVTYIPKFFIGVTSTYAADNINHYLKEKNANTVLSLDYLSGETNQASVLLGPAASMIYRFNSIVGVGLNASFLWHKVNFTYNERMTNLVTNEVSDTYYRYHDNIQRLYIGVNVYIGFGRRYDWVGEK